MSRSSPDYAVGFGRPPTSTRFKQGQSGNPRGRPKGSRNIQTLLREELEQKVPVSLNGRTRLMSKKRVAVRQQVDKAVKGDTKSFAMLVRLEAEGIGQPGSPEADGSTAASEVPSAAYEEIVAAYLSGLTGPEGGDA